MRAFLVVALLLLPAVASSQAAQTRTALLSLGFAQSGSVANLGAVGDVIAGLSGSGSTVVWHGFLGGAAPIPSGVPAPALAPATFLSRPSPSPALGGTVLRFGLAAPQANVRLEVFDVSGRLVATLISGSLPSGGHERRWDLRDERGDAVDAGVYFARLSAGAFRQTRRLVVLK